MYTWYIHSATVGHSFACSSFPIRLLGATQQHLLLIGLALAASAIAQSHCSRHACSAALMAWSCFLQSITLIVVLYNSTHHCSHSAHNLAPPEGVKRPEQGTGNLPWVAGSWVVACGPVQQVLPEPTGFRVPYHVAMWVCCSLLC